MLDGLFVHHGALMLVQADDYHLVWAELGGSDETSIKLDPAIDDDMIGLGGGAGRMTGPVRWDSN